MLMQEKPSRRLSAFLVVIGCATAAGCDQEGPRVFTAMPVDTEGHCLGPYAPIGVIDAQDLPATCEATCLTLNDTLYVSEVCAPYPTDVTVVSAVDSPVCAEALTLSSADGGGACESE